MPRVYALNGALYIGQRDWLLKHRSFIAESTVGYSMPPERSADLDSSLDWQWVEFLMRKAKQ